MIASKKKMLRRVLLPTLGLHISLCSARGASIEIPVHFLESGEGYFALFMLCLILLSTVFFIAVFIVQETNRKESRGLIDKYKRLYDRAMVIYRNLPVSVAQYDSGGNLVGETPEAHRTFSSFDECRQLEANCFSGSCGKGVSSLLSPSGYEGTIKTVAPSGKYFRLVFNPVKEGGKTLKYVLFALDVTRLEEQRFRLGCISDGFAFALKDIDAGAMEYDTSADKVVYSTEGWYSLLEIGRDVSFKDSFANVREEDRKGITDFLENAGVSFTKYESRIVIPAGEGGGHTLTIRLSRSGRRGGGSLMMGIVQNMDEETAREEQIRWNVRKTQELYMLKSRFVANMSHEIKTPLNAIVGFSDLLVSADEPAEREVYSHFIKENNKFLLALIDSIAEVPSAGGEKIELSKEAFDLNDLMEGVAFSTSMMVDQSKIKVVFEKTNPKMIVVQDKGRLRQVVSNLASNAAKYTERGFIKIGYTPGRDGWLEIYVKDTGIGISEEDVKKLFTRYVRAGDPSEVEGYGLGLSIVKQIVDAMGGTVVVDSVPGKGSIFTVRIKKE